jgi:predicted Holliday junction resolvase-like endonuclease
MGVFLAATVFLVIITSVFILVIVFLNEKEKRELVRENMNLIKRIEELEFSFRDRLNFELENYKKKYKEEIENKVKEKLAHEMEKKLESWKKEKEKEIVEKIIKEYGTYILKNLSEKFAPFYIMYKYNIDPRDIRFIGCPVDYIAFKGLEEKDFNNVEVLFIKVNQDDRELTDKEKAVKKAVEEKRVKWLSVEVDKFLKENISVEKFLKEKTENSVSQSNQTNA